MPSLPYSKSLYFVWVDFWALLYSTGKFGNPMTILHYLNYCSPFISLEIWKSKCFDFLFPHFLSFSSSICISELVCTVPRSKQRTILGFFLFFFFAAPTAYASSQVRDVPQLGEEPVPWQRPKLLQWQYKIFNPMHHKRTPEKYMLTVNALHQFLRESTSLH